MQFRSEALPDGEMKGPQADVGVGWWGKLYEESGRGVLSDNKSGEKLVKVDDWNEYEIVAEGSQRARRTSTASCAWTSTIRRCRGAASSGCRSTPAGRWRCGSRT